MTDLSATDRLADRYGSPRRGGRVVVTVAAVIAAVFLAWLAWSTWANSHPQVTSQLQGWTADGPHEVSARFEVQLDARGVVATCTLRAYAEDHSTVGERDVEVGSSGRRTVTLRTERAATAVELVGCTTPGQHRPH